VTLQAARNELCVIDIAITIGVHYVHKINAIILSHGAARDLLDTYLQLLYRELAITIFVKLRECIAQLLDLIFWYPRSYQSQRCALEILRLYVVIHVLKDINRNYELLFLFLSLSLNPWMIKRFLCSESHISLPVEEFANQIFSLIADLLPHTR
jgi:hypothetical protein